MIKVFFLVVENRTGGGRGSGQGGRGGGQTTADKDKLRCSHCGKRRRVGSFIPI